MFDASLCGTNDLRQMTDVGHQLVEARLSMLRRLGHSRDIELLFVAGDYCRPDWNLVEGFGDEAQQLVRDIFVGAHDVAQAEDELALRMRPN
jgi:hypothetical protein